MAEVLAAARLVPLGIESHLGEKEVVARTRVFLYA
jgi:hypothetical protein